MDDNAKKDRPAVKRERRYLRTGALALLVVAGLGAMAGMAAFNGTAKPNRDMKWYVRAGAVQVAAPAIPESTTEPEPALSAGGTASEAEAEAVAADMPLPAQTVEAPTEAPVEVPAEPSDAGTDHEEEEAASGTVTLTITAAGDCTFGGEVGSKGRRNFQKCVEEYGYDYFFRNVRHVFEADDLTIVNLEGPLTTVEKAGKHGGFIFKGDPECVSILADSSVELCNLANNHILDYGKAGLKETAEVLADKGIHYCGFTSVYDDVIKGVRVRALGCTWWDYDKDQIVKAVSAAREGCDLLIVNIHWGWEGHHDHDDKQTALGHAIIDAGADLLIGTHPHVYAGIEKYKGKYIVYSLGNFCFAGNYNPADKRCLIFQQTFSFNPGMGIAQANLLDMGINIIPATVSSRKDVNDFQPTIMSSEDGAALLKAVVKQSTNFTVNNVRWMKDNYLLTYGLMEPEAEPDSEGDPVTAEADAAEAPDDTAGKAADDIT